MATELTTPAPVTVVVDDPKKPWKALAALIIPIAITVTQLVQSNLNDGAWTGEDTTAVVLSVLGALLVYLVPNPKVAVGDENVATRRANGL